MKKLTFLLGAGASVGALPTVVDMPERFGIFIDYLEYFLNSNPSRVGWQNLIAFINKGREFESNLNINTSFDSYARLLYKNILSGSTKKEFEEFKFFIGKYFLFEQLVSKSSITPPSGRAKSIESEINQYLDMRYNAFLSEFYDFVNKTLPSNINVITWNIDLQFEIAFDKLLNKSIESAQNHLKIFPSHSIDINSSQILKLNGTAGGYYVDNVYTLPFIKTQNSLDEFIRELNSQYHEQNSRLTSAFYFAWENENPNKDSIIKKAQEIISESDILVIVGYSFQRPNFEIDKEIFSKIRGAECKIYFQVYQEHFNKYKDKLKVLNRNKTLHYIDLIEDLREFYVPYDFGFYEEKKSPPLIPGKNVSRNGY